MASFEITYWLGAAHIVFLAVAFVLTSRPLISTYHWLLLSSFVAFGLRPVLAASVGGFTNYDSGIGWSAYNHGLLYQLLFITCLSAAYIPMYRANRPRVRPLERVPGLKAFHAIFGVGVGALCALLILWGGAWLPGVREGTMNSALPGAKYVFPFAVMAFSIVIPAGVIGCMKHVGIKPWMVVMATTASLTALSLLYMRGMVITGVFLILWAVEKEGKLKAKHILIGLFAILLIGQLLRPIGKFVALRYLSGEDASFTVTAAVVERLSPLDRVRALFLYTWNMDIADSWPVVIDYVDQKGHLDGRGFLAIPARFASTKFRLESGYRTGGDVINDFFYGPQYMDKSFGFQVTLANELFLNFGLAGLLLGVLPGIAAWAADNWLRGLRVLSPAGLFIAYACFRGFTNELAITVQWACGALLLALIVQTLTYVRIRMQNGRPGMRRRLVHTTSPSAGKEGPT